ncbi:alpha carbonic anhydrase [Gaertneriomyces semiglobifer]|nr:alpha carbonic anhydrase [Gaertneriomyces semiglobifer]
MAKFVSLLLAVASSVTIISALPLSRRLPVGMSHTNCMADVILNVPFNDLRKRAEESIAFGYSAFDGPNSWAPTDTCQKGQFQSPINFEPGMAANHLLSAATLSVQFQDLTESINITNTGHTIQVDIPENRRGQIGFIDTTTGQNFDLQQFHFHVPSEHRKDLVSFPLEMHMVHQQPETKQISVLGFWFEVTDAPNLAGPSQFTSQLAPHLTQLTAIGSTVQMPGVRLGGLLSALTTAPQWTYNGSLTTPPCSENVAWHVVDVPLTIPVAHYQAMNKIMGFNSRPVQKNANVPQATPATVPTATASARK